MAHKNPFEKKVVPAIRAAYPDAAKFVETCWSLTPHPTDTTPRDKTINFWIYPTRRAPEVSRAYAVLNEILDVVPGSIIYVEEACRKFVTRLPHINPKRPFSDAVITRIWTNKNMRRAILRELEKACDLALNPKFGFEDSTSGGGGGSGGGPTQHLSAAVNFSTGKGSGGNS